MMTFTYVALLSGLISWNLPGGADSIMNRISVRAALACTGAGVLLRCPAVWLGFCLGLAVVGSGRTPHRH